MNKYEAAYNMMMILSIVDGNFIDKEGNVIVNYLREMHQPFVGTKNENPFFLELTEDQLISHFKDSSYAFFKKHNKDERLLIFESAAREFYAHSLDSDRETFIDFAKQIIMADNSISKEENLYINQLFKLWGYK